MQRQPFALEEGSKYAIRDARADGYRTGMRVGNHLVHRFQGNEGIVAVRDRIETMTRSERLKASMGVNEGPNLISGGRFSQPIRAVDEIARPVGEPFFFERHSGRFKKPACDTGCEQIQKGALIHANFIGIISERSRLRTIPPGGLTRRLAGGPRATALSSVGGSSAGAADDGLPEEIVTKPEGGRSVRGPGRLTSGLFPGLKHFLTGLTGRGRGSGRYSKKKARLCHYQPTRSFLPWRIS